ncbi:MAG: hypothetical protein KIT11_03435 [Fimbriimonadaceae bacterium]|nr:hypothetical protein [Fimbriimonadaceae bacterium]QYK57050.1 MAG: hypothetical protein KF733_06090 [Fimbriimonadaceae bacterium]
MPARPKPAALRLVNVSNEEAVWSIDGRKQPTTAAPATATPFVLAGSPKEVIVSTRSGDFPTTVEVAPGGALSIAFTGETAEAIPEVRDAPSGKALVTVIAVPSTALRATLDGKDVGLGKPLETEPGKHKVQLPGAPSSTLEFGLADRESATVFVSGKATALKLLLTRNSPVRQPVTGSDFQ